MVDSPTTSGLHLLVTDPGIGLIPVQLQLAFHHFPHSFRERFDSSRTDPPLIDAENLNLLSVRHIHPLSFLRPSCVSSLQPIMYHQTQPRGMAAV